MLQTRLATNFLTSLSTLKMETKRSGSDQLKSAGRQGKTAYRPSSRGSRVGEGLNTPAASGSSVHTPLRGRVEDVLSGLGGGDGGTTVDEAATSRVQIPESGICTSSIGEGSKDERVDSHKKATPSWRCGFSWLSTLLKERLRAWDEVVMEDCECSLNDLYNDQFSFKYVAVEHSAVPHIIGRKGRVIRQLEEVCGVFLTLQDLGDSMHELYITGPRPSCILAEFAIDMLSSGQHSVLTTLSSLCF